MSNTIHFVLADFGRLGSAWVERDQNETDLESTIRFISELQVDKPLKVIAVDVGEQWAREITEDVAREILSRHEKAGEPLHDKLAAFIEKHVPDHVALSIRRAA